MISYKSESAVDAGEDLLIGSAAFDDGAYAFLDLDLDSDLDGAVGRSPPPQTAPLLGHAIGAKLAGGPGQARVGVGA